MTGHSPKLTAALGKLKKHLEAMPEPLRGPFVVEGLAPYMYCAPAPKASSGATTDPVEILARAFCHIDGLAPDDNAPRQLVCGPYGEVLPNWEAYREKAEGILAGRLDASDDWLRDTAMNVMLATEVEEATRILSSALAAQKEA